MTDYTKTKVADIQPGVNGDNVAVKIITCKETKEERGRLVAEGTCGDETAIINFRVVGKSAEACKVGASVLFVNAKSEVYEEIHRLGSGTRGRVIVLEADKAIAKTNDSKNMSDVKYEKIVLHNEEEKKRQPRENKDNRGPRRDNRDNRRDNRDNRDNRRDNRDNRDNRHRNERRHDGKRNWVWKHIIQPEERNSKKFRDYCGKI